MRLGCEVQSRARSATKLVESSRWSNGIECERAVLDTLLPDHHMVGNEAGTADNGLHRVSHWD